MKKILIAILLIIGNTFAQTSILFIGDSLTAGYGIAKEKSFPNLIEKKLTEQKFDVKILNGGVSGSTSASVESRLKWYLKAKPEYLFLAIGANDGLRGVATKATRENIDKTIKLALKNNIKVILAGMKLPPNYGGTYIKEFELIYQDMQKNYKLDYVEFLLEGVAGNQKYNQEDGIHPNEEGHQIIAKNLEPLFVKILKVKK